jgi:hypothetical protein
MIMRLIGLVLVLSLALTPAGCRPRKKVRELSAPSSRVEHFKQRQSATELTHGRIQTNSVAEESDGRIRYQTSDGKTWLVAMTPDESGGYRYGTPEEVK